MGTAVSRCVESGPFFLLKRVSWTATNNAQSALSCPLVRCSGIQAAMRYSYDSNI